MPPISVVIITKNEAKNIKRCIVSALKISNDVIVIDSGSTDDTISIAKSCGAKVYENNWIGYGPNKNLGNRMAENDWVLSLDADEELDHELISCIHHLELKENTIYTVNRITQLGNTWIKHSGWHPLFLPRLFEKEKVSWNDSPVHESLIIPKKFNIVKLNGLCLHYSFDSKEDFENRLKKYARLKAKMWAQNRKQLNWFKKTFGPFGRFLTVFLFKRGILDGRIGYYIAKEEAKMVATAIITYKEMI